MKKTIFTTLTAMFLPLMTMAQDDMYFTPTKAEVKAAKEARQKDREAEIACRKAYEQSRGVYYSGLNKTDDEYNRRSKRTTFTPTFVNDSILASTDSMASDIIEFPAGNASQMEKGVYPAADETRVDTVYKYIVMDDDDYRYSRWLSRYDDFYFRYAFHNPLYSPWYYNSWYYGPSWNHGWYAWNGWYDPFYDPWYGPGWGWYDPWYHPWHGMGWGIPAYPSYRPAGNAPTQYAGVHYRGNSNLARGHNRNTSYAVAKRNGDRTTRTNFTRNNSSRYSQNSFNRQNNWNNNNYRPANNSGFSNSSMGGNRGSGFSGGSHSGGTRSAGGFGGRGGGRR
ncbi:MAG: hypothetical protein NC344_09610 [Bacteroidales bacterium]|nr:hypothetical protein [Bacteroidales bacterium]MCM1148062.1 hypothetical protein [Bacteroidales bacterium]MCM1207167.1 hypothetical protein [Bacillota bacterium]MCM1509484.1 hypothetical protein [Clostridium sp.]